MNVHFAIIILSVKCTFYADLSITFCSTPLNLFQHKTCIKIESWCVCFSAATQEKMHCSSNHIALAFLVILLLNASVHISQQSPVFRRNFNDMIRTLRKSTMEQDYTRSNRHGSLSANFTTAGLPTRKSGFHFWPWKCIEKILRRNPLLNCDNYVSVFDRKNGLSNRFSKRFSRLFIFSLSLLVIAWKCSFCISSLFHSDVWKNDQNKHN